MQTTMVDGIPLLVARPDASPRAVALHLPAFGQTKEEAAPVLERLSQDGYIAISLDPWQHGERGKESREELAERVFGNFRRYMWPILGQTVLDTLRIADWALSEFGTKLPVTLSGLSMGGDAALAAAGLDTRILMVFAVAATPDWLRPGMHDLFDPSRLLPPGQPDPYAQFFYDHLDPVSHLARYARSPRIHFLCGGCDTHVPPDGAARFKAALNAAHPETARQVTIASLPNSSHLDLADSDLWLPSLSAFLRDPSSI